LIVDHAGPDRHDPRVRGSDLPTTTIRTPTARAWSCGASRAKLADRRRCHLGRALGVMGRGGATFVSDGRGPAAGRVGVRVGVGVAVGVGEALVQAPLAVFLATAPGAAPAP
jgi:hypothetical protein